MNYSLSNCLMPNNQNSVTKPQAWHTSRNGTSYGPFTDQQMRLFAQAGRLKPTDYVWRPGMEDWMPANRYFRFPEPIRAVETANYPNPYGECFDSDSSSYSGTAFTNITKSGAVTRAVLFGALGVHKFYLGYHEAGVIILLFTFFTCGYGVIPMVLVGFIEGVIYSRKTDDAFYRTYVQGKRDWM